MQRQFSRFAVAGVIGFVIDTGVLYLMLWLGLGYFAGRALSFVCAACATWQLNRRYTFTLSHSESVFVEWLRYLAAMSLGGGVNYGAYSAVVSLVDPTPWLPALAVATGSVAALVVNFATAKWWVFKHARANHL